MVAPVTNSYLQHQSVSNGGASYVGGFAPAHPKIGTPSIV